MAAMSDKPAGGKTHFKVGTRKSQLAMIQTTEVVGRLQSRFPEMTFEVVARTTVGDERLDVALNKIGEKSLFTKELETCLESGEVDLVVHSLKDLPTALPPGMVIGAILEREDPRDAVVVRAGSAAKSLSELEAGSVIGTSSVRRAAQIRANFPHLAIEDVRGNLNTRFRKLDNDNKKYAALILAAAGVKRMGWNDRIEQSLTSSECLHAVGQGALVVECREGDEETLKLLKPLRHRATMLACATERAVMRRLEGGCSAPVAAHAEVSPTGEAISVEGGVWSLSGGETRRWRTERKLSKKGGESETLRMEDDEDWSKAEEAGLEVADKLLAEGAGKILEEAKKQNEAK